MKDSDQTITVTTTINIKETIKNIYFLNGIFLFILAVIALLCRFIFMPFNLYCLSKLSMSFFYAYTMLMLLLQVNILLMPFLEKYGGDDQSLTTVTSYTVGLLVIITPLMYFFELNLSYNIAISLLTAVILFCNSVNLIAKENREVSSALPLNIMYTLVILLLMPLSIWYGLHRTYICLPIILLYALDQILKSSDFDIPWYSMKKNKEYAVIAVILSGAAFIIFVGFIFSIYYNPSLSLLNI